MINLQKGKCNECILIFKEGDIIENDHIQPKKLGINKSFFNAYLCNKSYQEISTFQNKNISFYLVVKSKTYLTETLNNRLFSLFS